MASIKDIAQARAARQLKKTCDQELDRFLFYIYNNLQDINLFSGVIFTMKNGQINAFGAFPDIDNDVRETELEDQIDTLVVEYFKDANENDRNRYAFWRYNTPTISDITTPTKEIFVGDMLMLATRNAPIQLNIAYTQNFSHFSQAMDVPLEMHSMRVIGIQGGTTAIPMSGLTLWVEAKE